MEGIIDRTISGELRSHATATNTHTIAPLQLINNQYYLSSTANFAVFITSNSSVSHAHTIRQ